MSRGSILRTAIRGVGAFGLACVLAGVPAGLSAQSEQLARVDRLLEDGRFGEARTVLEGWLDGGWDGSSRQDRQHGLWLRAVLTIDPGMAELDLRRLVVEYPGGSFSDEALLRLAHAARLRRDDQAAVDYLEILVRDYPESPHRVEARSLLSRMAGGARPEAATEPAPPPAAPVPAETVADAPSERDDPPPAPTTAEPAAEPGPYTVQLGAFSTETRALTLALEIRDAGFAGPFEPRVVRLDGSELARVRIGGFATRDEAQAFAAKVRERGFEAVVSSDRDREERVR